MAPRPRGPRPSGPEAADGERRTGTPLEVLPDRVRIGDVARRLSDGSGADALYKAYLAVLYAVRRAEPGQELTLRSQDLDILLEAVGDDVESVELRLVELMGCTQEEASALRRVLLRHRSALAAAGVAAGVTLAAVAPTALSGGPGAPAPQPVAAAPASPAGPAAPAAPVEVQDRRHTVVAPPALLAAPAAPPAPVAAPAPAPPAAEARLDAPAAPAPVGGAHTDLVPADPAAADPAVEVGIPTVLAPPLLLVQPGAPDEPATPDRPLLQDPRRGTWPWAVPPLALLDEPRPQDAEGDGDLPEDAVPATPAGPDDVPPDAA